MAERKSAAVSSSQCTDNRACDQPGRAQTASNPAKIMSFGGIILRITAWLIVIIGILPRLRILALP